jgi:uncharacterized protein (TIGR03437 family)
MRDPVIKRGWSARTIRAFGISLTLAACLYADVVIVNTASGLPAVAPGTFITAYGSYDQSAYFETALGNSDTIQRIPTIFWSPTQINGLLPISTPLGAALGIGERINGADVSGGSSTRISAQAPGIFQNPALDCAINAPGCPTRLARPIVTGPSAN